MGSSFFVLLRITFFQNTFPPAGGKDIYHHISMMRGRALQTWSHRTFRAWTSVYFCGNRNEILFLQTNWSFFTNVDAFPPHARLVDIVVVGNPDQLSGLSNERPHRCAQPRILSNAKRKDDASVRKVGSEWKTNF